jgi:hypothetical protein
MERITEYCKLCGSRIKNIVKRRSDYEREVGELLELEPQGFNVDKQPYFDLSSVDGLKKMAEAIKKIKEKK